MAADIDVNPDHIRSKIIRILECRVCGSICLNKDSFSAWIQDHALDPSDKIFSLIRCTPQSRKLLDK